MMKKFEERFLMKENKEIEQILLNDSSYEKFVSTKVEKEFIQEINNPEIKKKKVVTDIKSVPKEKLFSKDAYYLVMNKKSKTKSYINGIQAEAFLGGQNSLREKFLTLNLDSFVNGDYYVKFQKLKV